MPCSLHRAAVLPTEPTSKLPVAAAVCAIQEGGVDVACASGATATFVAGDCFLMPAGLVYSWRQHGALKKFFVEMTHPIVGPVPEAPIAFDKAVAVEQKQWWSFCAGEANLAKGTPPHAGAHTMFADPSGQASAGIWTCTGDYTTVRRCCCCLQERLPVQSGSAGQAEQGS